MNRTVTITSIYFLFAFFILISAMFYPLTSLVIAFIFLIGAIFYKKEIVIPFNPSNINSLIILFPLLLITTINRSNVLGAGIIVILFFTYCITFLLSAKYREKSKTILLNFFLIWFIYASCLMIFGTVTEITKSHYQSLVLGVLIIFLLLRCVNSVDKLKQLYNIWGIALFLSILVGWVEVVTDRLIFKSNDYELNNIATVGFYNPNDYSFLLTISLPIILYWLGKKRQGRLIGFFMLISAIYFMYMNETRLSLFVAFCLIGYYILKRSKKSIKTLFGSLIFLFIALYYSKETLAEVFDMVKTMFEGGGSYDVRSYLTMSAYEIFKQNPLGIGPGNIENLMVKPHNFWIEILVNYGLFIFIGLVLFFAYALIKLIRNNVRMEGITQPIIWIILIFIVTSSLPSSIFQFNITWVVFGLMICGVNIINKRSFQIV